MPLNLNDFTSEIRSKGTQKASRFLVMLSPPSGLNINGTLINAAADLLGIGAGPVGILNSVMSTARTRQLALRCSNAVFPGIQLMTKDDITRYGMGPVDTTVHNAMFTNIQCAFIVDREGLIQDFFYKWQRLAVNSDSSDTMTQKTQGASPYEVSYKHDYVSKIDISKYDDRGKKRISCVAHQAFPVSVGEIGLGWDQSNSTAILPVTFSYRDHKVTTH